MVKLKVFRLQESGQLGLNCKCKQNLLKVQSHQKVTEAEMF